jgi:hypothetical protein
MMLTRFINIIDFKKFKNLYLMKFFLKKRVMIIWNLMILIWLFKIKTWWVMAKLWLLLFYLNIVMVISFSEFVNALPSVARMLWYQSISFQLQITKKDCIDNLVWIYQSKWAKNLSPSHLNWNGVVWSSCWRFLKG